MAADVSEPPVAPVGTDVVVLALGAGVVLVTVVAAPGGVTTGGTVEPVLAGPAVVVLSVAEVVPRASVEAAGPGLLVEHAAAIAAANTGRLDESRDTPRPVTTTQTNPLKLPAKSSPNSVASTPNMLRKVVYSLLCGSFW